MMKYILILFFVIGCKNNQEDSSYEKDSKKDIGTIWSFEDISQNVFGLIDIDFTHRILIHCNGDYLPVRDRIISDEEIVISNSGSQSAQKMNEVQIIAYLQNDSEIELIEEFENCYKIKFIIKNEIKEGYIIKIFCGKSTIVEILNDTKKAIQNSNVILNPELLPFSKVFINERFYNLLSSGSNSNDPLKYLLQILGETQGESILFSIFVGESKRELVKNPNRVGNDMTQLLYGVRNTYYIYEFSNYPDMFVVISPELPQKINLNSINNDELKIVTENYDGYHDEKEMRIRPLDSKRAFTSKKGSKWILNDSIKLIDISYLKDKIDISETQIGHEYFYELLELFIQEILPKRTDTYLEHYLDDK